MGALARGALLVGSTCLLVGCKLGTFACQSDNQCGDDGMCQPDGNCSFPDDDCESGQRYGGAAGGDQSGECVPPDDGSGSTGTAPTTTGSTDPTSLETTMSGSGPTSATISASGTATTEVTAGTDTGMLEDSGTTVAIGESGSTGDANVEICDDIDNDGDGLIDEWSRQNPTCGGCTLDQNDGRAYWWCDDPRTWQNSENFCRGMGPPTLAISDSASVNTYLAGNIDDQQWWIGLFYEIDDLGFVWIDGTPFVYESWAPTQPDGGDGMCTFIAATGEWFDVLCTELHPFVCSTPHDP